MKYTGWPNVPTLQFKEIIAELEEAKDDQRAIMMIAPTGSGKSHAIKAFTTKNTNHVYVFTLGDSYNLNALLNEIIEALGLNRLSPTNKEARYYSLRKIKEKLVELGQAGHKPMLIFDEAENARIPMLKAFKELYDAVIEYCSIVLIGTDQLIFQLNKKSVGQSLPQLRRRFKAGTRFITPVNKEKDFKRFFELLIPKVPDLQDLLLSISNNYGELHDYLEPVLKKCDKKSIPVTEQIFRLHHKIPKTQK